jgi:hypothetical protein
MQVDMNPQKWAILLGVSWIHVNFLVILLEIRVSGISDKSGIGELKEYNRILKISPFSSKIA